VKEKITIEQVLKKYAGGGFKAFPEKTALSVSPTDVTQKGIFWILSLFPRVFSSKKRRRYSTISS
jgi:hypothetical protein